jgi:hypothetical protein
MTEQTDRSDPGGQSALPSESPDDNYQWTAEEEDPDAAGMPAEFANEPGDGVPGVRSGDTDPTPPPSGEQVE